MHLTVLVSKLLKFFIPKNIEKIAKDTGFMKRHSKILPTTIAKALTFGLLGEDNITEEAIALKCSHLQNGLSVTKQAIKNKLKGAVPFLKQLLVESFKLVYSSLLDACLNPLLNFFDDIKLLDATTISLPDCVKETYKGLGGTNADAALKIQVVYSALTHAITQLDLTSAVDHDATYLKNLKESLSNKELLLADLGYFDLSFLKSLEDSIFFISRIKTNTTFYECYSEKYNLFEQIALKDILSSDATQIDRWIYLGKDPRKRLKVRIVGERLPDEVAKKRIQKALNTNNHKQLSEEKRLFLHWNLMITNVSEETLPVKVILNLYRLRWQIELLFKCLKSHLKFDKMNFGKVDYVEALLYGRLVATLLTMPIYNHLDQTMLQTKGRGLSLQRFYRLLLVDLHILYDFSKLTLQKERASVDFFQRIACLSLHEKRKNKTTMEQLFIDLQEVVT